MLEEDLCNEQEADGWVQGGIEAAKLRKSCSEYTLDEVIGNAVLRDATKWVAVDACGDVREFLFKPGIRIKCNGRWQARSTFDYLINKVVPPLNFVDCMLEAKKGKQRSYAGAVRRELPQQRGHRSIDVEIHTR